MFHWLPRHCLELQFQQLRPSVKYIYITESLIDLTRAKGIAGNGCHGHVHLSVESQAFEPVEASFRKLKKLLKTGVLPLEAANT